jgi:hypothetical protein
LPHGWKENLRFSANKLEALAWFFAEHGLNVTATLLAAAVESLHDEIAKFPASRKDG